MNRHLTTFYYLLPIFLLTSLRGSSQIIINDYNQVTALAGNIATLSSLTGTQGIHTLAIGDTVLIIQMQGAAINQTNTAAFGNVTVNNAGNYEINVICNVDAANKKIAFKFALLNVYTPGTGGVQIVTHGNGQLLTYTVPAAGIKPQALDGTTGGVAFIKANVINLNGPVTASGLGFRGGASGGIPGPPGTVCNQNITTAGGSFLWNNGGCNGASNNTGATNYFYPKLGITMPFISPPNPAAAPANLQDQYTGGWKGEGIAAYVTDMETGRGKQANGGGGGQTHNSGGAGGSLYGAGGSGGNQWNGASPSPLANGGVGGATLTPSAAKLFMGGGGGGGHANYPNGNSSAGANGGGIILFRGNTLTYASSQVISSNGADNIPKLSNDSEGGGGAGGSIYFDVSTITPTGGAVLTLNGNGGNGGNSTNSGDCIGPGGGGGGGYFLSRAVFPGSTIKNLTGGTNGITTSVTMGPCMGAAPTNAWGATAGTNGLSVDAQAAYKTQLGTVVVSCVLPVELASFHLSIHTDKVIVSWVTAMEKNNNYFIVERSSDGSTFENIAQVSGAGNSSTPVHYSYTDNSPDEHRIYYRIKQVDFDGRYNYSGILSADIISGYGILQVYPQPVSTSQKLMVTYRSEQEEDVRIQLTDGLGRNIYTNAFMLVSGVNQLSLNIEKVIPGIYYLTITTSDGMCARKIIVE